MNIKAQSDFKEPASDRKYFEEWTKALEKDNGRSYERYNINTSLGVTQVYGLDSKEDLTDTLVIFPGARTTSLIWDLDKGLNNFGHKMRIFMIETNGLPNLSSGATPDIKSLDYGAWAAEVLDQLKIEKAFFAGASFGGLICMKLAIVKPEKVIAAFLLNPGCLQPFSLKIKNLFYNLLPIIRPSEKNVSKFLDKAVFSKPTHQLSPAAEKMLIDYEVFALKRYMDKTQKPYYMGKELNEVNVPTYLLEGDKDLLFPYERSIANAKKYLKTLMDVQVFPNVGHGIETYAPAIKYIGSKIKELQLQTKIRVL